MNMITKPLLLIILDGFGCREDPESNAICQAQTPAWDKIWQSYPHTLLNASGNAVGLPKGQMGNSEVGHLVMGAGRILYQDLCRIDSAIEDGSFFKNSILMSAFQRAQTEGNSVHVLGLLSDGGVHSHERHWHALLKMASNLGAKNLFLHPFLDGRDTAPKSAANYLLNLENSIKHYGVGTIASLMGRFYAMDRDQRLERTKAAYEAIVEGRSIYSFNSPKIALKEAYSRNETDEFIVPTCITQNNAPITISANDSIIFLNFRSDRARQLTDSLVNNAFSKWPREQPPKFHQFISLTEYDSRFYPFGVQVAFPREPLNNTLAEYLSRHNLKQLRITETEKYPHVTFFFNGGKEAPYPLEDRRLIPSPKVVSYDLEPQMSALPITDELIESIKNKTHDVIICNFANADMVGHSGNLRATINAVETLDKCLAKIHQALLEHGGEAIITADHGNAECMYDFINNQPHTAHTTEPVPFVYIGRKAAVTISEGGLQDIAPTLLHLLNLTPPKEMTGRSLVEFT